MSNQKSETRACSNLSTLSIPLSISLPHLLVIASLILIDLHEEERRPANEGEQPQDDERHPPRTVKRVDQTAEEAGAELHPLPELPPQPSLHLARGGRERGRHSRHRVDVVEAGVLPQQRREPLLLEVVRGAVADDAEEEILHGGASEAVESYPDELERDNARLLKSLGRHAQIAEGVGEEEREGREDASVPDPEEHAQGEHRPVLRGGEEGQHLGDGRGGDVGCLLVLVLLLLLDEVVVVVLLRRVKEVSYELGAVRGDVAVRIACARGWHQRRRRFQKIHEGREVVIIIIFRDGRSFEVNHSCLSFCGGGGMENDAPVLILETTNFEEYSFDDSHAPRDRNEIPLSTNFVVEAVVQVRFVFARRNDYVDWD